MDCVGFDHSDNSFGGGHLRNETHPGQPESKEKEDCRERRDERGELLQPTEFDETGRYKPTNQR